MYVQMGKLYLVILDYKIKIHWNTIISPNSGTKYIITIQDYGQDEERDHDIKNINEGNKLTEVFEVVKPLELDIGWIDLTFFDIIYK